MMFLLLNLKFPPPRLPILPSHARPTLPHTCILHVSPRVRTYPPKSLPYNKNYSHSHHVSMNTAISSSAIPTKMEESIDAVHLRSHFLQVLQSRRPSQPQGIINPKPTTPFDSLYDTLIFDLFFDLFSSGISWGCKTCGQPSLSRQSPTLKWGWHSVSMFLFHLFVGFSYLLYSWMLN